MAIAHTEYGPASMASGSTTRDVSVTIGASTTGVLAFTFSDFTAAGSVTVEWDPTGTPLTVDQVVSGEGGSGSTTFAQAWWMGSDDGDWPGTGTHTLRATFGTGIHEQTVVAYALTGSETSTTIGVSDADSSTSNRTTATPSLTAANSDSRLYFAAAQSNDGSFSWANGTELFDKNPGDDGAPGGNTVQMTAGYWDPGSTGVKSNTATFTGSSGRLGAVMLEIDAGAAPSNSVPAQSGTFNRMRKR